jgi:hypothetical protein
MAIEDIINDFNSTALTLINVIAMVCPKSTIGRNQSDIEKAIKNKQNRTKFIDIFVSKVLIYKDKIMSGNDSFFLTKEYDSDLDSNDHVSYVFEFKDVWQQLNRRNKDTVIQYMQILCLLSEQYFLEFTSNNK